MNQATQYASPQAEGAANFLDGVGEMAKAGKSAGDIAAEALSARSGAPEDLRYMLDSVKSKVAANGQKEADRIMDSVLMGAKHYEREHGRKPTGDVVAAAVQQGLAAFRGIDPETGNPLLDSAGIANSASSAGHDPISLQANRAVTSVFSLFAEAIPFAGYLPFDIGSNQAKLMMTRNVASSAFGDYQAGATINGVNGGGNYASSARTVRFTTTGSAPYAAKFSRQNLASAPGICDPAADGVPVFRGRTIIYVNGMPAGRDQSGGAAANSPFTATANVGGTDYALVGTVTVATGAISITSISPAAPSTGFEVTARGFIDYEKASSLTPSFGVITDTYDLFATPWRADLAVSIDSDTQHRNEAGLDPFAVALQGLRNNQALERHYAALAMVQRIGDNYAETYDFEWAARNQDMTRARAFQDFHAFLHTVDQKMANRTMDHGSSHWYVDKWMAGILKSLPPDVFTPSGVAVRPGIYRIGRLASGHEFYYTPRLLSEDPTRATSKMIGVGRASDVACNPIQCGDAVAPTYLDQGMLKDMNRRAGVYARDFTEVNPNPVCASGCVTVTMTNLA